MRGSQPRTSERNIVVLPDAYERLLQGAFGICLPYRKVYATERPQSPIAADIKPPALVWEDDTLLRLLPRSRYDLVYNRARYGIALPEFVPLQKVWIYAKGREKLPRLIQDCRIGTLHSISEAEAIACGFVGRQPITARAKFKEAWRASRYQQKFPWDSNPVVLMLRLFTRQE